MCPASTVELCPSFEIAEAAEPSIYFITGTGNIKAISLESFQVKKIIETTRSNNNRRGGFFASHSAHGIAYDSIRQKLYWSSGSQIYRAYRDGSGLEIVFDTSRCESITDVKRFYKFSAQIMVAVISRYLL